MEGYFLLLLKGALVTLQLALLSLAIATGLGLCFAFLKLSKIAALRYLAAGYTSLIRGLPELVLILFLYFGAQILLNHLLEAIGYEGFIEINAFLAGALTIGFIFGAYMTETFRGAILAIDKGQLEAAKAFAMPSFLLLRRILLPQMAHHGITSFTNNWLVLLKSTALISVLGINDLVRIANVAGTSTRKPFLFYFVISLIYLCFTAVSLYALRKFKERYHFE